MKLLMILPTSAAGGHHALYGLAVAQAARDRSWQVDLATPTFQLDYPVGMDLKRVVESTDGKLVDIPCVSPKWTGVLGYVEGQLRRWALVREAGKRAGSAVQYDVAYVNDGDGWYLPCCVMGTPIRRIPIVTVMLRTKYHHGSLSCGAGYPVKGAWVQRLLLGSFLRCRCLAAIVTPDRPWAEFCSSRDEVSKKVRYVPDMGAVIVQVDRDKARKELKIDSDKRLVLCLGKMDSRKGVSELLTAVADQACPPSVGVLFMGMQDECMTATSCSESVVTLEKDGRVWVREGAYSQRDLSLALSASDAVWLGYRNHPFSSSVLWEAAQAGMPVLGCDHGLIAWEIRSHDLGETVNIFDPTDVISALKRILFDTVSRERWRENGLRFGALHTPERFGEEVAKVLEDVTV